MHCLFPNQLELIKFVLKIGLNKRIRILKVVNFADRYLKEGYDKL